MLSLKNRISTRNNEEDELGIIKREKCDIKIAEEHFLNYEIPRRVIDGKGSAKMSAASNRAVTMYRRVENHEKNRGELYPINLFEFDMMSFSHFGLGVGQYFVQLVFFALLFSLCSLLLIPSMVSYYNYEHSSSQGIIARVSVTCADPIEVIATSGCDNGASSCNVLYREDCSLSNTVVTCDLVFCVVFIVGVFIVSQFEQKWGEKLDEAIQTPQDYSLIVTNPPSDASNPDEWHAFFSKYGDVQYITITKKNASLGESLVQKYQLIEDYYGGLDHVSEGNREALAPARAPPASMNMSYASEEDSDVEYGQGPGCFSPTWTSGKGTSGRGNVNRLDNIEASMKKTLRKQARLSRRANGSTHAHTQSQSDLIPGTWAYYKYYYNPWNVYKYYIGCWNLSSSYWIDRMNLVEAPLARKIRGTYPVNQVYVCFNTEKDKRICMEELEVPDAQIYFPWLYGSCETRKFRGNHLLNVLEPTEPDNILWENTEVGDIHRRKLQLGASVLACGMVLGCYYIMESITDPLLLALVVGMIDTALPFLFYGLVFMERPCDMDDLHDSALVKLFVARVMISTIFANLLDLDWVDLPSSKLISSILLVQVSVCFLAPLSALADTYGLFERHIVTRTIAKTQDQMNYWFRGSFWLLSDRYSGFAKVIFISLFWALLTPGGIFIAALACVFIFLIDRYLLFRRWRRAPMMDAAMATRFRQQVFFAIAAHLYISTLMVAGWPFDEAIKNVPDPSNPSVFTYHKVIKEPSWNIFDVTTASWMSDVQMKLLIPMKIVAIIVALIMLYMWVGDRIVSIFKYLFTRVVEVNGGEQEITYAEKLHTMRAYCPTIEANGKTLAFADVFDMHAKQKILIAPPETFDLINLAYLIPKSRRSACLGVVKYYGSPGSPAVSMRSRFNSESPSKRYNDVSTNLQPVLSEVREYDLESECENSNTANKKNLQELPNGRKIEMSIQTPPVSSPYRIFSSAKIKPECNPSIGDVELNRSMQLQSINNASESETGGGTNDVDAVGVFKFTPEHSQNPDSMNVEDN